MTVYVVVALDLTDYRLVKVFSKYDDAVRCKEDLKELLWRKITITTCYVDDYNKRKEI